jgi:hypothetical protein
MLASGTGRAATLGGGPVIDVEEVRRQDRRGLPSQELPPGLPGTPGAGSMPASLKICQTVDCATS